MPYDEVVLVGVLFFQSYFLYFLMEEIGATVEDGDFGSISLDEAVVDSGSVQSRHEVFDGTHSDIPFLQDSTSLRVGHILRHTVDHWLSLEVQSFDFVSEIFRSWFNSSGKHQSRMESFSHDGETILQCQLLLHNICSIFVF